MRRPTCGSCTCTRATSQQHSDTAAIRCCSTCCVNLYNVQVWQVRVGCIRGPVVSRRPQMIMRMIAGDHAWPGEQLRAVDLCVPAAWALLVSTLLLCMCHRAAGGMAAMTCSQTGPSLLCSRLTDSQPALCCSNMCDAVQGHRDAVRVAEAEALMAAGDTVKAARLFGSIMTPHPPFEDIALRLVDAGQLPRHPQHPSLASLSPSFRPVCMRCLET